jgi:hypothetical protein
MSDNKLDIGIGDDEVVSSDVAEGGGRYMIGKLALAGQMRGVIIGHYCTTCSRIFFHRCAVSAVNYVACHAPHSWTFSAVECLPEMGITPSKKE